MRKKIDGPERDQLTKEEVCQYLRISDRQLDALIAAGEFPKGVPYGRRGPLLWLWEDCAAVRHLRSRLPPKIDEKEAAEGKNEEFSK